MSIVYDLATAFFDSQATFWQLSGIMCISSYSASYVAYLHVCIVHVLYALLVIPGTVKELYSMASSNHAPVKIYTCTEKLKLVCYKS